MEAVYGSTGGSADDILEKMSFIHIDSNMVPYISPEEYATYHERYLRVGRAGLVDERLLEALKLHTFSGPKLRRQPHGGWPAMQWSPRRWPKIWRAVRRDPRPRLAHLRRRHRR